MTSSNQNKWHSLGDFLKAKEEREKEEVQESTSNPTPATQGTETTLGSIATQGSQPSVAPSRDFMKVANSISRTAVPAGTFTGKSKQIYDYLYSRTRGAIQPTRSIQLRRREIMDGAHVGSDKTLRDNLLRLRARGLINWSADTGLHAGNTYTVFLPEEIESTPATQGSQGSQGYPGYPGYFLPTVPRVETTLGSQGLVIDSTGTYEHAKTLYKTNTENDDDDAALAGLRASFKKATKEITGRELSPGENDRWRELADVLVAELKIAAGRTTVSSVPAFLAEHLRRRLWKLDKKQARAEGRELPDEAVSAPREDANGCPDCSGSGWWYPQGVEKGVAKCKHEKLKNSKPQTPS